ncbi:MAG: ATP-binding protein [Paludibacteraceae bacterium]|nr:ATP-binding protein [Paludibacteraceae bacterium]
MSNNVQIVCSDVKIEQKQLDIIVNQVIYNANKSGVLNNAVNCDCIKLFANVRITDYPTAKELNSKIYWVIEENVNLSNTAIRNFLLRCLHLELGKQIDSLLIVFLHSKENADFLITRVNSKQDEESDEHESVKSFVAIEPKHKLNKVVMSATTQRQIERAIALIRNRKKIYEDWGFVEIDSYSKTILCFYGSPGTGKTMCAHALASELGKKILIASYASIESKWVGEGPKNLQTIFKDAETQDAILFFDEADSFLSKRVNNAETGSEKHYNRMSNEMFQLLEDYNGIVIFATNLVTDFDKAFKSRILAFIEFEKPDLAARKKLISLMIPPRLPLVEELSDSDIEELAVIANDFSGRDIRKAMLITLSDAAMRNVEVFSKEQFYVGFKSVKEELNTIEQLTSESCSTSIVEDFLKYNKENQAILVVCLKALWLTNEISTYAKEYLIRLSKMLDLGIPDFSISYKSKEISKEVAIISEANRLEECARYCCELFAYQVYMEDYEPTEISTLLREMSIENMKDYYNYIDVFIKILKQ